MPFYDIHHSYPLSATQRSQIAQHITKLHCTTFTAPYLFANVRFKSVDGKEDYFYGGQRRNNTNRIFAYVRSGPSRTKADFDKLAAEVEKIWDDVVGKKEGEFACNSEKVLQAVFVITGAIVREEGFTIPEAGEEGGWIEQNMNEFQRRADAGDSDMKALIADIEKRPELRGNV